jgi:hypothetical protein
MKRWTAITTILASTVVACTAVWFIQHGFEKQKDEVGASHRQLIYQSILQSYSASFSNGMTRAQVQDSLRTRGVQFDEICCLIQGASYAEITKIGFETGPWYCTGYDVYVAFHFSGPLASQNPTDILKKISIESLPVDCL